MNFPEGYKQQVVISKLEAEIEALKNPWVRVRDELPGYGDPILLLVNNTVQHVTYMLDGADESKDWFEPYHFDHDDNCKLFIDKATAWMPLPRGLI